MFLKLSKTSQSFLATFVRIFFTWNFQKIAQSGHTGVTQITHSCSVVVNFLNANELKSFNIQLDEFKLSLATLSFASVQSVDRST